MLSNKDFAQLLATPESSSSKVDGKVRFDLKQISDWDKQNKAKVKSKGFGTKTSGKGVPSNVNEDSIKQYRDRAEERRKDANPDYDSESIAALVQLDAEKTKYLGGDVDHTHLVKGLDLTLLKKIRQQVEQSQQSTTANDINDLKKIRPITQLGYKLKEILIDKPILESEIKKNFDLSSVSKNFSRLAYDFDLDLFSNTEVPTTIARSKQEEYNENEQLNFILSHSIIARLGNVLINAKNSVKLKRKRRDGDYMASTSVSVTQVPISLPASQIGRAIPSVSIFDDLDKYVPPGALHDSTEKNCNTAIISSSKVVKSKETYFSDLKPVSSSSSSFRNPAAVEEGEDSDSETPTTTEDILAPVRAALKAQAERDHMSKLRESGRLENDASRVRDRLLSEDEEDDSSIAEGKIHRDVFGGLLPKGESGGGKRGNAMGGVGSYDLYPENADNETYDSDEGEEAVSASSKKQKTSIASIPNKEKEKDSKKVNANDSKRKDSGATASSAISKASSSAKTNGTKDGMNRAARRAAAKGGS